MGVTHYRAALRFLSGRVSGLSSSANWRTRLPNAEQHYTILDYVWQKGIVSPSKMEKEMPDIEAHGYSDPDEVADHILNLVKSAPYAGDLSFDPAPTRPRALVSFKDDRFLRIFASAAWQQQHKADLLQRLSPRYGIEFVTIEWHPQKS